MEHIKPSMADWQDDAQEYINDIQRVLEKLRPELGRNLPQMIEILESAQRKERTVYTMGNGGSGATASHLANDLNKYTAVDGQARFRCVSLVDNIPHILAIGNDIEFEEIFAEQLRNFGRPGDVLIGISGSGESENCIRAIDVASNMDMGVITWTGFGGGRMAERSDCSIVIPSDSMTHCEDAHVVIHHCLVQILRNRIKSRASGRPRNQLDERVE